MAIAIQPTEVEVLAISEQLRHQIVGVQLGSRLGKAHRSIVDPEEANASSKGNFQAELLQIVLRVYFDNLFVLDDFL